MPSQHNHANQIFLAAARGDLEALRQLLLKGTSPNTRNEFEDTPLHEACSKGRTEAASILLKAGADPNVRGYSGYTPLHEASRKGFLEAARLLLDGDAEIDLRDDSGQTPLHLACSRGRDVVVELLLNAGANANVFDDHRSTPLYEALHQGHESCVERLVRAGAHIDPRVETILSVRNSQAEQWLVNAYRGRFDSEVSKSAVESQFLDANEQLSAGGRDYILSEVFHRAFVPAFWQGRMTEALVFYERLVSVSPTEMRAALQSVDLTQIRRAAVKKNVAGFIRFRRKHSDKTTD